MSAASQNVGTKLLFENARVRVWALTLEPGESSELHRHLHDYLFVNLGRAVTELHDAAGEALVRRLDDEFVQYNVVGREGQPPHRLKNVGENTLRQILIEFLGESVSPHALDPETNGGFF